MARIRIFQASGSDVLVEGEMPLDVDRLAAPVAAAGRDWLRLQGRDDAARLRCWTWWNDTEGPTASLDVGLANGASGRDVVWEGRIASKDLGRIARRAANALEGAGLWSREDRASGELRFEVLLDEDDPTAAGQREAADPAARAGAALGMEVEPEDGAAEAPLRAVFPRDLAADTRAGGSEDPDVVIRIRADVWKDIGGLTRESAAAREERALVLFGERFRLMRNEGSGASLPLFDVTRCVRPKVVSASATRIVLAPMAFVDQGQAACALLHSHLSEYGLAASDHDRRDLEDLPAGGPGAVSIIVGARKDASQPIRCAVWARLGSRGGAVGQASSLLLVSEEGLSA